MGLADAVCSRSLRFVWRVRVQVLAMVAFFAGGCIGSLVFQSSFGAAALTFPCIALCPMWIAGGVLLVMRHTASAVRPARPSDLGAAYVDTARGATSQLDTPFPPMQSSRTLHSRRRFPLHLRPLVATEQH